MALYWGKYFFVLIGVWAFWCSFNAGYPGFFHFADWAFTNDAFKKAMVWSIAWELFGFGCGWGPMNARFDKWFGGYRHFARPGTIKLPLFRGLPLIGGDTRNFLDVGLYVLNQVLLLRVLVAPEVTPELLLPCFVLVAVNGVLDKTLFLVARYEHYWIVMAAMTFAAANDLWIAGAKLTWSFIWIWAAVSKWNSHFPSVIMFMMNNGPFFPKMLKKRLFRSFPDDLRPSAFAEKMALFGHVSEFAIPVHPARRQPDGQHLAPARRLHPLHRLPHLHRAQQPERHARRVEHPDDLRGLVPLLVPSPEASVLDMTAMPLLLGGDALLARRRSDLRELRSGEASPSCPPCATTRATGPTTSGSSGRAAPSRSSASSRRTGGTVNEQLADLVIEDPIELEFAKNMMCVSRFMHFQGRPLLEALPVAVDDIEDYDWHEGELLGGDHPRLELRRRPPERRAAAARDPAHLRVRGRRAARRLGRESQPLFGPTMHWRVYDAVQGQDRRGEDEDGRLHGPPALAGR